MGAEIREEYQRLSRDDLLQKGYDLGMALGAWTYTQPIEKIS